MTILLSTLNARYTHASLGLRYLLANMGELQAHTRIQEFVIGAKTTEMVERILAAQPKIVGWGLKFYGPKIFPTYPFEEGFFLKEARQFRSELKLPIILLGGINRLDTIENALEEGFDFVAMGRALLRDPDVVNKCRDEKADEGLCIHCNKCMPTIYSGTHCVIREALREAPQTV